MMTAPARRIISNMQRLQLPSETLEKPKTNGMMSKKSNFTPVDAKEDDKQPIIRAKEIQMYIRKQNKKRNGLNETA